MNAPSMRKGELMLFVARMRVQRSSHLTDSALRDVTGWGDRFCGLVVLFHFFKLQNGGLTPMLNV